MNDERRARMRPLLDHLAPPDPDPAEPTTGNVVPGEGSNPAGTGEPHDRRAFLRHLTEQN